MSSLGKEAVPCETALEGTKTQVLTASIAQGNCISKHLWINLYKQAWIFLANSHSARIHCVVCQSGLLALEAADRSRHLQPPNHSPTATIMYPKDSTPCPGWLCNPWRENGATLASSSQPSQIPPKNACLFSLASWLSHVQYFISNMSLMMQVLTPNLCFYRYDRFARSSRILIQIIMSFLIIQAFDETKVVLHCWCEFTRCTLPIQHPEGLRLNETLRNIIIFSHRVGRLESARNLWTLNLDPSVTLSSHGI